MKSQKKGQVFTLFKMLGPFWKMITKMGLPIFWNTWHLTGTEHFEGKGIINTLEKHGVAFGRNINAYTSFGETVYNMSDVRLLA